MRVFSVSPLAVGIVFFRDATARASVIVKISLRFDQTGSSLAVDTRVAPLVLERPDPLLPGFAAHGNDFVPRKARVDLTVHGSAHLAELRPSFPVEVSLGSALRKRVVVVAAVPSLAVPLLPGTVRTAAGEPAALAPLSQAPLVSTSPRGALEAWWSERWIDLPAGDRGERFQCAPLDQQTSELIGPGTPLHLANLVRGRGTRTLALPPLSPWLLLRQPGSALASAQEIALRLDSVHVDTDSGVVELLHRGELELGALAGRPDLIVGLAPGRARPARPEIEARLASVQPSLAQEPWPASERALEPVPEAGRGASAGAYVEPPMAQTAFPLKVALPQDALPFKQSAPPPVTFGPRPPVTFGPRPPVTFGPRPPPAETTAVLQLPLAPPSTEPPPASAGSTNEETTNVGFPLDELRADLAEDGPPTRRGDEPARTKQRPPLVSITDESIPTPPPPAAAASLAASFIAAAIPPAPTLPKAVDPLYWDDDDDDEGGRTGVVAPPGTAPPPGPGDTTPPPTLSAAATQQVDPPREREVTMTGMSTLGIKSLPFERSEPVSKAAKPRDDEVTSVGIPVPRAAGGGLPFASPSSSGSASVSGARRGDTLPPPGPSGDRTAQPSPVQVVPAVRAQPVRTERALVAAEVIAGVVMSSPERRAGELAAARLSELDWARAIDQWAREVDAEVRSSSHTKLDRLLSALHTRALR